MSILDSLKGLVNADRQKQGRREERTGEATEELERPEDRADAKARKAATSKRKT